MPAESEGEVESQTRHFLPRDVYFVAQAATGLASFVCASSFPHFTWLLELTPRKKGNIPMSRRFMCATGETTIWARTFHQKFGLEKYMSPTDCDIKL
jgi:hypothetical protein